ncbi:hypothetical protein GCM10027060_08120 [Nesterenkonia halophila]|uniref:DUF2207 domain-containing protein n=1 Tax=Nesterenkonia halophila TaxID=302044 RepID=UPI00129281D8|nr:DUF2207 domain-containing protein [Nesterenkonia halophila]
MPRLWRGLPAAAASAALMLGMVLGLAGCSPDPEDDVVRSLDIAVDIDAQGTLHVTETYSWDFGTREGLGFRRDLIRREPAESDEDRLRVYEYDDFEVSSSSGAPADVWTEEDGDMLRVGVGSTEERGETRTGVQGYELSYTVDGAMTATTPSETSDADASPSPTAPDLPEGSANPGRPSSAPAARQILHWNVTGQQWQVPIEHVDTTITAPEAPLRTSCQAGDVETIRTCQVVEGEDNVTVTAAELEPGQGLTVQATYPPDTVEDDVPQLITPHWSNPHRYWPAIATVTDPVWTVVEASAAPLLVVVAVVSGIWMVRRIRRDRDDSFVGLPPGTLPAPDAVDTTPTTPAPRRPSSPARPAPPERLAPAEAAVVAERRLPQRAVGATLLDLAARGHVELTPAGPSEEKLGAASAGEPDEDADAAAGPAGSEPSTWLVRRTAPDRPDSLADFEATLLDGLFGDGAGEDDAPAEPAAVRLDDPPEGLGEAVDRMDEQLHRRIDERRFFRETVDPRRARPRWGPARTTAAIVGTTVGAVAAIVVTNGFTDNAPLIPDSTAGLAAVLAGLIALWLVLELAGRKLSVGRTALGRAHAEQACGFRRHLAETTSQQLRDAPDARRISRHLAYAVALGVAEQWAAALDELDDGASSETARAMGLADGPSSMAALHPGAMVALADSTESFGHQAIVPSGPGAAGGSVGGGAGAGMPGGGLGGGGGAGR